MAYNLKTRVLQDMQVVLNDKGKCGASSKPQKSTYQWIR